MDSEISSNGRGTLAATKERSLVVYIYDRSDPVFTNNLNYFIRRGIAGGESCDYVFIVQNAENPQASFSGTLSMPWSNPHWVCHNLMEYLLCLVWAGWMRSE